MPRTSALRLQLQLLQPLYPRQKPFNLVSVTQSSGLGLPILALTPFALVIWCQTLSLENQSEVTSAEMVEG